MPIAVEPEAMAKTLRQRIQRLFAHNPDGLQERFPAYRFGRGTYGVDLRIHSFGEGATLTVGAFCSIAQGVQIFLGGEHRVDWVTTYPFNVLWKAAGSIQGHPKSKGDVHIGHDVWIGVEAVILSGVTIGHGAVIGARAVVTRDVAPYAIVAGNPGRFIRNRFDDETIDRLLRIGWWHWDDGRIRSLLPLMLSGDVHAFLKAAEACDGH
jgi:acetyltransferase-like isoleucine patch superfamily enzyme